MLHGFGDGVQSVQEKKKAEKSSGPELSRSVQLPFEALQGEWNLLIYPDSPTALCTSQISKSNWCMQISAVNSVQNEARSPYSCFGEIF